MKALIIQFFFMHNPIIRQAEIQRYSCAFCKAITGEAVKDYFTDQSETLEQIKTTLKISNKTPLETIEQLIEENNSLKKEMESLKKDKAKSFKSDLLNSIIQKKKN